ncbi:hypothetical protein LTS15_002067 [Exophiala xenobiotica]|nr:hypothetical protein LTS15_002067 [Exophiala xenobiotica]
MGRWGHRMFEGDLDLDLKGDVTYAIEEKLKAKSITLEQDHLEDLLENMANLNYRPTPSSMNSQQLLDHINTISDELFEDFIQKKEPIFGDYTVVIFGAVMMGAGAKISPENMTYLRQAADKTESHPGHRLPIGDLGFRDPGKAQFLAALNHYRNGEPRDLRGPSCFCCGRINQDLNPRSLMKCGRCKEAWYCNQECQQANWKNHKLICRKDGELPLSAGGFRMLNV